MGKEKEICGAIRGYFSVNKITMKEVADRLGVTSGAVTNQLAGRQFSAKMAKRYAEEFGFSEDYLLFGRGSLVEDNHEHLKVENEGDLSRLIRIIESQQETIAVLAQKVPGKE